jgi:hypothetical protein
MDIVFLVVLIAIIVATKAALVAEKDRSSAARTSQDLD